MKKILALALSAAMAFSLAACSGSSPESTASTASGAASSAASAASAAVDTVRSLATQTPEGDWYSVAVCSDGSYGIEKGLICSFPVRTTKDGGWEIVQGLPVDAFSREKIDATVNELKEERDAVSSLLKH